MGRDTPSPEQCVVFRQAGPARAVSMISYAHSLSSCLNITMLSPSRLRSKDVEPGRYGPGDHRERDHGYEAYDRDP